MADTALFSVAVELRHSEALPHLSNALPYLEALHGALVRASDEASFGRGPSPCFTARTHEGAPLGGHRHAALAPLSLSHRGRVMDHVLVHSPMGFDVAARTALRRIQRAWVKGFPGIIMTLLRVGTREELAGTVAQLRAGLAWRTVTPFVPPRFLKPRGTSGLEGQAQAELASRGLPRASKVEVELDGGAYAPVECFWELWNGVARNAGSCGTRGLSRRWQRFHRQRQHPSRRPPLPAAFGLRLSFDEPVRGPIALGYASHFGLGQLVPC